MKQNDKIISVAVILLIVLGIIFLTYTGLDFYQDIKIKSKKTILESTTDEKYILTTYLRDPIKGIKDAQISIYIFSDYETRQTKNMIEVFDELMKEYPDKVNLVWKDLPMTSNRFSKSAALAGRCAGEQNKYWEYGIELFNSEEDFSVTTYQGIAEKLKLDVNKFLSCYQTQKYIDDIDYNITEAYVLNIKNIPSVFVNQQKIDGDITKENLENVIRSIIK